MKTNRFEDANGTVLSAEEAARLLAKFEELYTGPGPDPENVMVIDPLPVWIKTTKRALCDPAQLRQVIEQALRDDLRGAG